MKTLALILVQIHLATLAFAQGTLQFSSTLYAGNPGLNDRSHLVQVGTAQFTLTPERSFSGSASFEIYYGATGFHLADSSFNIFRSASSVVPRLSEAPGEYFDVVWNTEPLSDFNVERLMRGELFVYVPSSQRSPNGDVIGQITAVPEPTFWSIVLLAGGFYISMRKRVREN